MGKSSHGSLGAGASRSRSAPDYHSLRTKKGPVTQRGETYDHDETHKSLAEEAEQAGRTREEYLDEYNNPNNLRCMHGPGNYGHKYEGMPAPYDPPHIQEKYDQSPAPV